MSAADRENLEWDTEQGGWDVKRTKLPPREVDESEALEMMVDKVIVMLKGKGRKTIEKILNVTIRD